VGRRKRNIQNIPTPDFWVSAGFDDPEVYEEVGLNLLVALDALTTTHIPDNGPELAGLTLLAPELDSRTVTHIGNAIEDGGLSLSVSLASLTVIHAETNNESGGLDLLVDLNSVTVIHPTTDIETGGLTLEVNLNTTTP
jgi:hypothetical protein